MEKPPFAVERTGEKLRKTSQTEGRTQPSHFPQLTRHYTPIFYNFHTVFPNNRTACKYNYFKKLYKQRLKFSTLSTVYTNNHTFFSIIRIKYSFRIMFIYCCRREGFQKCSIFLLNGCGEWKICSNFAVGLGLS